jgi:hypothetical protein
MRTDNARLRRLLRCWPSTAGDAWKLAETLAKTTSDDSLAQFRARVDPATLELQ